MSLASRSTPAERPLLLVVEDEPMVRELIVCELEDAGYATVEAEDGEGALAHLRTYSKIALLFTDIRLPGEMSGWDIAECARTLRPGLPVVYATGYSGDDLRLVSGAIFLKKPYRPSAVIEAICGLGVAAAS